MSTHPLQRLAQITGDYLRLAPMEDKAERCLALMFAENLAQVSKEPLAEQRLDDVAVRALRYAPQLLWRRDICSHRLLYDAACFAFNHVHWTEFYEEDDWSRSFLSEFANGEGIGPDGRLWHDEVILGLFVLGPHTVYPLHAHPAEEFYVVLSGAPEWQVGAGKSYETVNNGEVVIHRSEVSHSIRTKGSPLFAVYGWRGDINARSWYRDDMTDPEGEVKHPVIQKS